MNAKTIAQVMRTRIGAPGHTIMMTSRPSPAHSVVPVVEGSAKRFWVTSCMTSPLIDIAAPDRTSAIVRGTRTARKICQPSSWERIEYSPVDRDRMRSAATASVARASARGRRFDEAGAASRLGAASAGGAVVGECVIRKRGAGAAPEGGTRLRVRGSLLRGFEGVRDGVEDLRVGDDGLVGVRVIGRVHEVLVLQCGDVL